MENGVTYATFFIGGAADKNRFWHIGPKTNLIKNELIGRYYQAIYGTSLVEVNKRPDLCYFGYDEAAILEETILKLVKHTPSVKIRLIGHSLGGWRAAKLSATLAAKGIRVALLITIDPVGIGYFLKFAGDESSLPKPVADQWINLLANHTKEYNIDDIIADVGIRWRPARDIELKRKPDLDIETPYNHADVMAMMTFPSVTKQSAWQALVAPR